LFYRKLLNIECLLQLYDAHITKRNIYDDVAQFQKQKYHLNNFAAIMKWLQEAIAMQACEHIAEVITNLKIRVEEETLVIEAEIEEKQCVITKI